MGLSRFPPKVPGPGVGIVMPAVGQVPGASRKWILRRTPVNRALITPPSPARCRANIKDAALIIAHLNAPALWWTDHALAPQTSIACRVGVGRWGRCGRGGVGCCIGGFRIVGPC